MTAPAADDAEDQAVVDDRIRRAVAARSRAGMSDAACDRLAVALTVPCGPPLGCGVVAGVECQSYHDGGPIRLGFHLFRGAAAGVRWAPTTDAELAEQSGGRHRAGSEGWWP